MRAAVLASFPRGTPLLIAASETGEYLQLCAELADPAIVIAPLDLDDTPRHPVLPEIPYVLLDGLDDIEEPAALLAALHGRTAARLFALVANAAHARGLATFIGGSAPARAHPFVLAELAPLFDAAGWPPLTINPIADPGITVPATFPGTIAAGTFSIRVDDAAMFERIRTAAYMVVADRQ
jgi:hypothetical protein